LKQPLPSNVMQRVGEFLELMQRRTCRTKNPLVWCRRAWRGLQRRLFPRLTTTADPDELGWLVDMSTDVPPHEFLMAIAAEVGRRGRVSSAR